VESPSRRVLFDYPSPYFYGNYTSPSEDLVALWFGGNGTGKNKNITENLLLYYLLMWHYNQYLVKACPRKKVFP
jgi:hypothetical protein